MDSDGLSGIAELGLHLLEALSPAILALVGWVALKLAQLIKAKVGNELVSGMLIRLNDSVFTAVKAIEQVMVKEIKASKDPNSDGGTKVTKAEAERIKQAAIEAVKDYWGVKGLGELAKVLGIDGPGLSSLLEKKVEAAVHDLGKADPT